MDLSVIILNYNVRYLLEACLESVIQAIDGIQAEVIVVDNASMDESTQMVSSKFPQVRLIENKVNVGFSKGNNLGAAQAKGDYLLILNPDTIIQGEAIRSALHYLKEHQEVGGVGVKMINGQQEYLQESKRGFPTLSAALFKLTGLNKLFPGNKWINHYYLGDLSQDGIHEVESLTGAFLLMPRALYTSMQGFDERFFMYGEDIDISYRIRKSGKKLIYLGSAQIMHLKGRSSNEYTYQHVQDFYQAMSVFVHKYQLNPILKFIILIGIRCTAMSSWIKRIIKNNLLPIMDLVSIGAILWMVQWAWATFWFKDASYFHHPIFLFNAVTYTLMWIVSLFLWNTYHPLNQYKAQHTIQAVMTGTILILSLYALLPDTWRSSRAVLLLSGVMISILLPIWRGFLSTQGNGYRGLLIGSKEVEEQKNALLKDLTHYNYFSYVSRLEWTSVPGKLPMEILGNQLKEQRISHIILDRASIRNETILSLSSRFNREVAFLMMPDVQHDTPFNTTIPGMEVADIRLNMMPYRVSKTLIQLIANVLILPWGWLRHDIRTRYVSLLTGKLQWVGYLNPVQVELPKITPALWNPLLPSPLLNKVNPDELNFEYAMHYSPGNDIKIILRHLFTFR